MHDTASFQDLDVNAARSQIHDWLTQALAQLDPVDSSGCPSSKRGRGRPARIQWPHLWLGLLVSVLFGMNSYQTLWRRMCSEVSGAFLPLTVTDDALVKRLHQAGTAPLEHLFTQVSSFLRSLLTPVTSLSLASFASRIVCLDETTWDAMQRHLACQRALPDGDPGLLPGKLAARFDLRTQQWDWVQLRANPLANCKADLCSLLHDLPVNSLILFDLGYFSFPWFDYLTQLHDWFVSRLREKTTYQLAHVFYRHEGILDALVWLGSSHGARAGHLVRLVRFYDGHQVRSYLTNVLDPRQLSLAEIARLYARRWDIELAFLTLKQFLGLHRWWSSHSVLMQQPVFAVLIIAQLLQAFRLMLAQQAGVDPFEVSLPLLVEYLPQVLRARVDVVEWFLTYGRSLGFIRKSSRLHVIVPELDLGQYQWAPADLPLTRKARYVEYAPRPKRSSHKKKPPS